MQAFERIAAAGKPILFHSGTPELYREEVLRKLYTIGLDIENSVIFGTDCNTAYDAQYALEILAMDKKALDNIGVSPENRAKYYETNFLRFLEE